MFLIATLISFVSFALIVSHLSPRWMRRLVCFKGPVDVLLHGTILWLFFGTSTEGLLQAEAAGILFSLWIRLYRYGFGYERFDWRQRKFVRYAGHWTRLTQ